jgi:hypothetical protein
VQIQVALQIFASLVRIRAESALIRFDIAVADHVRLQVVPIPVAVAADVADVRLLQMRLLVLPQTVHVLEPRRTHVALNILDIRMDVEMGLQVGLGGKAFAAGLACVEIRHLVNGSDVALQRVLVDKLLAARLAGMR